MKYETFIMVMVPHEGFLIVDDSTNLVHYAKQGMSFRDVYCGAPVEAEHARVEPRADQVITCITCRGTYG